MAEQNKLSKIDIKKVIRLNDVLNDLKHAQRQYHEITCLISIKSLCKNEFIYRAYCRHLFALAYEKLQGDIEDQAVVDLIEEIGGLIQNSAGEETVQKKLWSCSYKLRQYQNEHENVKSTTVRLIKNMNILVIEEIAASLGGAYDEKYAQKMIYHATRDYVETYKSSVGTGLTVDSIPMLEQVLEFWNDCF